MKPFQSWRRRVLLAALQAGCSTATLAQSPYPANPSEPAGATPQQIEIQGQRVRNAAGKQTLTRDELSRIPGSAGDPMRAVQSLPGVAAADDSSGAPAVRGARPEDNAYYVDFLPVGYLFHLGGLTSVFNPELIRRFDLASAAWSPEYGDVVGAVFDISLRSPRADRQGGKLDFSLLGASVLAEGPLSEGLSYFIAGRRSWFDLLARTVEDKEEGVTYTVPVYSDAQGRLLWTLNPDHRLRLDFSTAGDRIAFTTAANAKAAQREPVLVGNSNVRQSYATVALSWDGDFGRLASQQLALGRMVDRQSLQVGSAGRSDATVTTTYLREQLQLAWSKAHATTVGGSLNTRQVNLDLDFLDPRCTEFDPNCDYTSAGRVRSVQTVRQNQADAYANHRWRLAPDWALTGGLRVNRDAYLKQTFVEPRLGVEWNLSASTLLSAGWGRHNQPPAIEEALRDIGNPSLQHLRSNQVVVGIAQTLADGWSWRSEVYHKTFDGYAISDPLLNYRNGGSGSATGAELLVKKEATSHLSGFLSVSLSRAQRRNDVTGEVFRFAVDQPVIVSLVGQYKHSDAWNWGAKWSYHTGVPYTPVIGTGLYPDGRIRPLYGSINSERVPAYHRLDLRVDRRMSPSLSAYAELINAYGRKNVAGYSYSADYRTREAVYQLPTLLSFGIQYGF